MHFQAPQIQATIANNVSFLEVLSKSFGWKGVLLRIQMPAGEPVIMPLIRLRQKWVCIPHLSVLGGNYAAIIPCLNYFLSQISDKDIEAGKKTCFFPDTLPPQSFCKIRWEIRSFYKLSDHCYTEKILSCLSLEKSAEHQFLSFHPNVRRKIRKAIQNNIQIEISKNAYSQTESRELKPELQDLWKDFYRVYSQRMQELGSPALGRNFFENLPAAYQNGMAKCYIAYYKDEPVGAAISLSYQNYYENCWFATLKTHNRLYTSYLLHWAMIQDAIKHKIQIYSFGRSSKASGVLRYKEQWGGVNIPVYWNYSHPQKWNIRNMAWAGKIWKLLPLPFNRKIGAFIAKRIY